MTRDDPTTTLIDLIKRTPMLAIDLKAAEARGDQAAIAYHAAARAWLTEAAEAVAEARQSNAACARHAGPDAFARLAATSEMMRAPVAE